MVGHPTIETPRTHMREPCVIVLRSRLFDLALVLWTMLFAPGIPVLWLWGSTDATVRLVTRFWARGVLFNLRHIVGLDFVELGKIPQNNEPHLIISNHQSTWETIAFLVIFPDVAVIAKQELLDIPVFSWYLKHSPMIIIDRSSGAKALRTMIEQGCWMSATGRSILVFPEGSRMPPTQAVRFRRGIELLYAKLDLPVLPIALNSGLYWGRGDRCRRPGTIKVSRLPSIGPGLAPSEFLREVEHAIESEARHLNRR